MAQTQVRPRQAAKTANSAKRYLNRELSNLDFADRILAQAEDGRMPLLERVRFLAILSDNLDEFFQIRVSGLKEQLEAVPPPTSPDGMTPSSQLADIRERAAEIVKRQCRLFKSEIKPDLAAVGIRFLDADELDKSDRAYLENVFAERIFPVLTPLAVDPAHPFPYISSLSLNLAVVVRDPLRTTTRFARVKVPPLLDRFVQLPDPSRFVPLETVIACHLQALFPGMEVLSHHFFRVTRDGDLDLVDDGAEDLLAAIQMELRRQRRKARVVRLEVDEEMSEEVLTLLMRELELGPADVYVSSSLLDMGGLWAIYSLDRSDLKDAPWAPVTQPRLRGAPGEPVDMFAALRGGDILVHHPYDSFATSVEAFIEQAARDPQVLAIKQTLYRTSGPSSPIAHALISAAETGKQVVALVELKARGDEAANIVWAQALEEAGVHIVYGVVGLKTHAKVTLVVRQEVSRIRRYVHIGTGNYNPKTAQGYEDLGLFSGDKDLGNDVAELFNLLTGYSRKRRYRKLLVAPMGLRSGILKLIRDEAAHRHGRIVIKVNNLVDTEIIDALYAASAEGAEIDLIVRGICCLRPGVAGLSEHIRVRSLVGRYLEHSRIYSFGNDKRGREFYIGSADLMDRNLDRRVEAVVPIEDPALKVELARTLDTLLADDTLAWELGPAGDWKRVHSKKGVNSQQRSRELSMERALGHPVAIADA